MIVALCEMIIYNEGSLFTWFNELTPVYWESDSPLPHPLNKRQIAITITNKYTLSLIRYYTGSYSPTQTARVLGMYKGRTIINFSV